MTELELAVSPLPAPPSGLGESPFWHPGQSALWWVDIPGRRLWRHGPATGASRSWPLPSDPGCVAPLAGGGLLLACRDGLWRLPRVDVEAGSDDSAEREPARELVAAPPYDPALQRFNDGRADPQGRFWVGTIHEPRSPALARLYRHAAGQWVSVAAGITVSNGLAFSPDCRTLYWSDTTSHTVHAFDFDPAEGSLSRQRVFASFPLRQPGTPPEHYGGRPDGAAVDVEGCYWVAMFEGAQLLRLSPRGEVIARVRLPVRCPTMPCFGGPDLRTLFVTTARHNRPAEELASQPWAGCVLQVRLDTPGLPVNFAKLP